MIDTRWPWVLLLANGFVSSAAFTAEEPPALEAPITVPALETPTHEALRSDWTAPAPLRAPNAPPPPVAERPGADRPGPDAVWVPGYWSWDAKAQDFAWVDGAWVVPPPGMIWVNGRWERDDRGWTRVAGSWSPRQRRAEVRTVNRGGEPDWRRSGPPAGHPDDTPGPAPDANAFYVPGHYAPDGDRLTWTPGFWARLQPGWDWVPARWVRRTAGWDFREGYWTRDPSAGPRRHTVARPADDARDLPPAIVESQPAEGTDEPAPRDPIAEAEADARATLPPPLVGRPLPPVVVGPGGRTYVVPYPVVEPPMLYGPRRKLYDPTGVVGATVPPFVRRMLDRVLP
jgi:hypothetical protein